jgi:cytochrome b6-f complex iron-sulfur subunit
MNMLTKTGKLTDARRAFLKKAGSLAVMSTFGVAFFTSCTDSEDNTPNTPTGSNNTAGTGTDSGITVANNLVTIDLDKVSALNSAGGWLLITQASLLVVNTGSNNFNALTSVCTHSGCDRNWAFGNNVFTCTCHNSRFSINGNLLSGPASGDLRSFATALNNKILTINL